MEMHKMIRNYYLVCFMKVSEIPTMSIIAQREGGQPRAIKQCECFKHHRHIIGRVDHSKVWMSCFA